MFGFDESELKLLKKLNTPTKIQDYLETLQWNFEEDGDTYMSPRRVIREQKAHCLEGALLAASALWVNGERPLLLDLMVDQDSGDHDHVVALFKRDGRWGATSKTNHAVLRYREPVYRSVGELAMSYFHEYFMDNGEKTLRSYSRPLDLRKYKKENWTTSKDNLWFLQTALDEIPHTEILTREALRNLRPADPIEVEAGEITLNS